ncbi:MAG: DUF58 domain-containing protein [Aestuariivita sp.]|nr:DUF58 domain-containing protein [Aestuariivita sp.]
MSVHLSLNQQAENEVANFPPLLLKAERLATTVLLGEHGRRRSGLGDDFWQYRPAQSDDSRRLIDHRRSATSDVEYVREREWQIAQSIILWVDQGASMRWSSKSSLPRKIDEARLLALAIAILAIRGGERVGMPGNNLPPRREKHQIERIARALSFDAPKDYQPPDHNIMTSHARALFISDFFGDLSEIRQSITIATQRGVKGVLFQILDPEEETFPYRGRTIFDSIGGTIRHQTLKASELQSHYLDRLRERKEKLTDLVTATGWQIGMHRTSDNANVALLWLYHTLYGGRT